MRGKVKLINLKVIMCSLALLAGIPIRAQVVDKSPQTDTLAFKDRLSLRFNALDWVLLMPGVGIEFDLGNKNWSRWALGVDVSGNVGGSHTFKPGIVFNLAEVNVELRNYWRIRQIDGRGVKRHTGFVDKLFSCRRDRVKHPTVTYYRGLYASYSDFSVKFGSEGKQGTALSAGLSLGAVRPLYVFANGSSLDMELGLSVGVCYARYDTYRHDRESDCYPLVSTGDWKIVPFPVVRDLRVGLVYRLGDYPSTHKYRWRYDCDYTFAALQDSINTARETAKINQHYADSVGKVIDAEFWKVYNAAARVNRIHADSVRREAEARQKAQKEAVRKQRAKEKAERKKEKKASAGKDNDKRANERKEDKDEAR